MKLITKEIADRMPGPLEQDDKGMDAIVHLKLFGGAGTWLITEASKLVNRGDGVIGVEKLSYEPKDGETIEDIELYGYCHIFEWEWGPVSLGEIEDVNRSKGYQIIQREKFESNGKYKVKDLVR